LHPLLTYMATIPILCTRGALIQVDVELGVREMPIRKFYGFPHVIEWIEEVLPALQPELDAGRQSPIEQVDSLLYDFIRGANIAHYERAHIMQPTEPGVFELKTPDVRFFGWFPMKDHFIAADVDTTCRCKMYQLYAGYRGDVQRRRSCLDLDPPKFLSGGIHNVLSS
jgi:hypothetical protein